MAAKETTYVEGIGRRKTASARVRLTPAKETIITVNDKPMTEYFRNLGDQKVLTAVLDTADAGIEHYTITVHVKGSGIAAQADAIRLGIARALVKEKATRRGVLKAAGYLERDQRSVERKKPGLRKARKRPAWSKR
ncbi:30S ribosomal protein S9 [Candidatus Kaiserbacteria bacterium]|nr:30S ribosomal protein S9 [Candidatus Kaiserbacteria bacterium]